MSTIPHPKLSDKPETDYMLFHTALKAGQTMSLVSPPLIAAYHLIRRKPISIRSFFWRLNLLAIGGTAVSVPIGAYMLKDESQVAMAGKRERLVSSPTQIRTDDYSLIGFTLGALITPTLLLKRAPLPLLLLGGGWLGMGSGILTHLYKSWSDGYAVKPDLSGMIEDLERLPSEAKRDVKVALEKRS
ncbi:hypothetical protein FFLO_00135 [Filobasidium floriforme]|uniref:Uncharacterized protein n=1 Tax=Filobasidium floriforme TaxID=5210 RepID=A0A8K0NTU4_9TREE|nr:hypothetical protein FFLO_00135 [Filobasidium floriforme]